ncbi:endopeptidase IV [Legionella bononiensis]|uniref:Endopeptidase IV n=1 Tax=Legionella bononiensis TaxID=2793102 RepID=A0ABS1WA83_9GAMM|nr:endopeptidase IV [Legionella bononiensis]MBL7480492.1 endopeptidase IV [Legionella bononiensis]MBL7526268.1 endopeptidase IV [Legionella bononiensis]MBL7563236.1 endopeptidase IV [Legionella bononiensis]
MNIITNRGFTSIAIMFLSGLLCFSSIQAAPAKKDIAAEEKVEKKDNNKFPTGCTPVGFKQSLKVLSLYPGKEGALQSMYFFFNQLPQSVSLYQMRDKDSEYSTRFNHTIKANSWAVLATGERELKFICTLGDGKTSYGKIVDCADTIKICEYVNVKFGLNNKGNFWIVDSNSRNGAVSEVVHYGIIPGV